MDTAMSKSKKFIFTASVAFAALLSAALASCVPDPGVSADTPGAPVNTPPAYTPRHDIEVVRNGDPSDYYVLTDAKAQLDYDTGEGLLYLYVWRIESFDFLREFDGIRQIIITECYIPEGVRIPKSDALNGVVELDVHGIYGASAFDLLADCLPLPKLDMLTVTSEIPSDFVFPKVDSLTDITVQNVNALQVIAENTHIPGALNISFGKEESAAEWPNNAAGVEGFASIQYLSLPGCISDISAVAGCADLKILELGQSPEIESLKPLYGLERLQEIRIGKDAYDALPEDERKHFSPANNADADAVHVYLSPSDEFPYSNREFLSLNGETIDSFDFLAEYPNLKRLDIYNCDIADGLILPKIETLTHLEVVDRDAIEIIRDNAQLSGTLSIDTGSYDPVISEKPGYAPLTNLDGLETFRSLESLRVTDPVTDLSALTGCVNLRSLSVVNSTSIDTLKPLYGLERLRMLYISYDVLRALPPEEQERFNVNNRKKPYLVHIEWRD
jgi:hypothetical protein